LLSEKISRELREAAGMKIVNEAILKCGEVQAMLYRLGENIRVSSAKMSLGQTLHSLRVLRDGVDPNMRFKPPVTEIRGDDLGRVIANARGRRSVWTKSKGMVRTDHQCMGCGKAIRKGIPVYRSVTHGIPVEWVLCEECCESPKGVSLDRPPLGL